jgi:hypothetical protein
MPYDPLMRWGYEGGVILADPLLDEAAVRQRLTEPIGGLSLRIPPPAVGATV